MKYTKILVLSITLLFFSSFIGLIGSYNPGPVNSFEGNNFVATSAPGSSISNTADLAYSLSGYTNAGTTNSGTVTLNSVENTAEQTFNFDTTPTWSQSSDTWTTTNFASGSIQYWGSTGISLYDVVFGIPGYTTYDAHTGETSWYLSLTTATIYFTLDGTTQSYTWSPDYSNSGVVASGVSVPTYYSTMDPSFSFSLGTGYYSYSVYLTVSASSSTYADSGPVESTTSYGATNAIESSGFTQNSIDGYYGWTYSGQSASASWTNPSNAVAFEWSDSPSQSGTGSSLTSGGNYYPTLPTGVTFTQSGDPNVPSYTISWATENVVESASYSTTSIGSAQNPDENQNWWNSSASWSISLPGGWLDGSSVDGKTWNTILGSYTVSNILSVGYGTSPSFDTLFYSGTTSGSFVNPSKDSGWTINPSSTENSGFTLSWNIGELINYAPNSFSPHMAFANSGSNATITFTTGEQITGENENININWEDGTSTQLNNVAPTTFSETHTYTGNYVGSTGTISYTPVVTVTNLPNAPTSDNAQKNTVESSNTYSFSLTDNPTLAETVLHKGNSVFMNFTQSNLIISTVSATINGVSTTVLEHSPTSYSVSSSVFGLSPVIVAWTLDPAGIVDTMSIQYASPLYPTTNSTYLTTLFSIVVFCIGRR